MVERYLRVIVVGVIVLCAWVCASAEGVYEAWVARYNGPANGPDYSTALTVDDKGNVYVTGQSYIGGGSFDYATIKYSPAGETLWVRKYSAGGSNSPYDIEVDDSGNVYVTGSGYGGGSTGVDYLTIKYYPNGDVAWVRTYDDIGCLSAYPDEATAIGVDDSGNVVVTGGSNRCGEYSIATVKYNQVGETLWVRIFGSDSQDDYPRDIAMDKGGNVYVTGYKFTSGTDRGYATIKYSSTGDTIWVRTYDIGGTSWDEAYALALDDSGYIYVTGCSGCNGISSDFATIKYAPNGDSMWTRRYNGPGGSDDRAYSVAVSESGYVYVTGCIGCMPFFSDYCTIKYSSIGDTMWVRRYNGTGNLDDRSRVVKLDRTGNIYVTGWSDGAGTYKDFATIEYAPNGDSVWVGRYNGPGNDDDEAIDLETDDSGNIYVTGGSYGISSYDFATIKYSPCVIPGDANSSRFLTLADVIATVNYIFNKPGCSPQPLCWLSGLLCRGDWNGDTIVTLGDVIQGVNYIFNRPGGPWNPVPFGACCD